MGALLFAVHPVHTEAVAGIVGQVGSHAPDPRLSHQLSSSHGRMGVPGCEPSAGPRCLTDQSLVTVHLASLHLGRSQALAWQDAWLRLYLWLAADAALSCMPAAGAPACTVPKRARPKRQRQLAEGLHQTCRCAVHEDAASRPRAAAPQAQSPAWMRSI